MTIYEQLWLMSVATVLVGFAWAWLHISKRLRAGLPALELEPARPVPWSIVDIVIMLALTFLINSIVYSIAVRNFGLPKTLPPDAPPVQMAIAIFLFSISCLVALLLTLLIVPLRTGATYRDLGVVGHGVGRNIALGVTVFFALSVPVYLVQLVLSLIWKETSHPLIEVLREEPTRQFFVISAFSAVLVAPIIEEFFFRVMLQGWLETFFHREAVARRAIRQSEAAGAQGAAASDESNVEGDFDIDVQAATVPTALPADQNPYDAPRTVSAQDRQAATWRAEVPGRILRPSGWAIVISAFVFALAHYSNGPDPIALFVFGLGLGYLYQRTHRVLPCIVVHVILNAFTLFQLWLYVHLE